MSREAAERLKRWLQYLGPEPTDGELDEMKLRWERGEEPPAQHR